MNSDTPPLLSPKHPESGRPAGRRLLALIGGLAAAGVLATLALLFISQATRKDNHEDYRLLCDYLMAALPAEGRPAIQRTDAEIKVYIPQVKQTLARMARRGRKLAPIAKDFSDVI
jgi:hypothetical protein